MELSEIRKKIDGLDASIRELILERLNIARDVVHAKIESGNTTIYREDREASILERLTEGLDDNTSLLLREIYMKIMVSSRSIQYRMLVDEIADIVQDISIYDASDMAPKSLICQGIEGAYSDIAASRFASCEKVYKHNFRDVFSEVSGQNYGILPLENTTEGMVNEVYDLLLRHGLYIVKAIDLPIVHTVMANKGARDVKYITAHSQALAQCSRYIEKSGYETIPAINNAVAARELARSGRLDIACICDKSNAERYGLEILDEGVANTALNTTRFIVVADRLIAPAEGGKVSIVFSMDNRSGTLAGVLSIIASYGISMSKIESRPIEDEKWEFRFYIDLIGNIREERMKALLYQMRSELPFIKILGSYDELDEETR